MLNFAEGWFNVIKANTSFKDPYVEFLSKKRSEICYSCDKRKFNVCSACGCPIIAKTRVKSETCPHKDGSKWIKNDESYFIMEEMLGVS